MNKITLLALSGAAPVLAAKILGRVIGQVAQGFDKEEDQLIAELSVYKAIQAKYPKTVISLPEMFKTQLRKANTSVITDEADKVLSEFNEEQRALWNEGANTVTEKDALLNSMPRLTEIYAEATANINAWDDMSAIAQWSLLFKLENELPSKIALYKSWADTDRAAGKTDTNAIRLQAAAEKDIVPLHKLVTTFLADKTVIAELATASAAGTRVPVRMAS